jgi:hypothetical protein
MGEGQDQENPGEEVEDLRLEAREVVCAASRLAVCVIEHLCQNWDGRMYIGFYVCSY